MRVVKLDAVFFMKSIQRFFPLEVYAYHVLQGAGNEKELLHQPQLPSRERLVVGIEYLGQIFRSDLVMNGAIVIADIKRSKIKGRCCLRLKEA